MRRAHGRFEEADVALAVVGQGTPAQSAAFVRKLALPYPVLSDPDRVGYAAYGLVEGGPGAFLNPASGLAMVRSLVQGSGSGAVIGNPRELGGAFAIDRGGIVRLSHPARQAGDHPTIDALLPAVPTRPG